MIPWGMLNINSPDRSGSGISGCEDPHFTALSAYQCWIWTYVKVQMDALGRLKNQGFWVYEAW